MTSSNPRKIRYEGWCIVQMMVRWTAAVADDVTTGAPLKLPLIDARPVSFSDPSLEIAEVAFASVPARPVAMAVSSSATSSAMLESRPLVGSSKNMTGGFVINCGEREGLGEAVGVAILNISAGLICSLVCCNPQVL